MEGKQAEIYRELKEIVDKVETGFYGTDEDVDADSIQADLYVIIDEVLA